MNEEPKNTIQIWRHPLKSGEVSYYMYHVHIGIDDVAGKVIRPGNIVPRVDADGWLCWEIPDNVQNRRLVRDSWSDPTLYTVIHVDATIGAEKVVADIKQKFNNSKIEIATVKKLKQNRTTVPQEQEAVNVQFPETEVSEPSLETAGVPRGMPMGVRK
jgi:hypothetical protein